MALTVYKLFLLLGARITYSSIKDKLLQHPKYPSLFSLTNTLGNFGLENKAVRVKREQLGQLETPFLAISKNTDCLLVKNIQGETIKFFTTTGKLKSITDFETNWDGLVVLVDASSELKENEYLKKRTTEKLNKLKSLFTIALLILISSYTLVSLNSVFLKIMFLTHLTGLFFGALLGVKEINKNTEYPFCKVGTRMDCDSVLNSKGAKIFSWLSLTDLVIIFFSSVTFIILLMPFLSSEIFASLSAIVAILGITSLPLSLYSIGYQGIVLKKWCILCLGTVLVLILNGFLGYLILTDTDYNYPSSVTSFYLLGISFALMIVVWSNLKVILSKSLKFESLHYSNLRLFNDLKVFQVLLEKQPTVTMDFLQAEVILGNNHSQNTLTVAMNPFCPACKKEYLDILELLDGHPKYAKVVIRFTGNINSMDKTVIFISKYLIDLYLSNKESFIDILLDWFQFKDIKALINKYPHESHDLSKTILEHSYVWSDKVKIESTPSLFLNDKKLPKGYKASHLTNILKMNPDFNQ
ncbi:vitamin K epoxide reductase family protein [Muricauda sp. TY007]|uniref:vitamin K epoxide reductase family protein n=1 Tax=Allomuricauda sp. TY007 TaxID=2683200 RepID=UPI00193FD57B|nr:vitamin K epoxide reductase family protein [Muricauda sp. TY007]